MFNPRGSDQEVVSTRVLWTGLCKLKVAAINPTIEELKAIGINANKEPKNLLIVKDQRTGQERPTHRLDVYVKNEEIKLLTKVSFFLEARTRYDKTGTKVEWTNKFGQSSWGTNEDDVPGFSWFKAEGARPALVGEMNLMGFLSNWANVSIGEDPCSLDDPTNLALGNIGELKQLFGSIPNNEVLALLGVKEDGNKVYQDVYTGKFDRPYKVDYNGWKEALNNQFSQFKSNWQNDFTLKKYTPSSTMTPDTPTNFNGGGQIPAPEGSAAGMNF